VLIFDFSNPDISSERQEKLAKGENNMSQKNYYNNQRNHYSKNNHREPNYVCAGCQSCSYWYNCYGCTKYVTREEVGGYYERCYEADIW